MASTRIPSGNVTAALVLTNSKRSGTAKPLILLGQKEDHWKPYASDFPFVDRWLKLQRTGKVRQFTAGNGADRVHPNYNVLVRTGRTSASKPNLQQVPREGGVRECYVPTDEYLFLILDYSFIELVTLSAICLQRYGQSRMAEVIREGQDPSRVGSP